MDEHRSLRVMRTVLRLGLGLAAALLVLLSASLLPSGSSLTAPLSPPTCGGIIWRQTDWSGGPGQTAWLEATRYYSGTNVDGLSDPGNVTLARTGMHIFYEEFITSTYKNEAATTAYWNTSLGRLELSKEGESSAGWGFQANPAAGTLEDISFVSCNTGWGVGRDGLVLRTLDGGTTWSEQESGTTEHLKGVHFVDADHGWAVGSNGTIIATGNGGITWQTQQSSGDELLDVYFVDANTGWAVGVSGTILNTSNGGNTWSSQSSGTSRELRAVHFLDANTGWVVGEQGTILGTTDGGTNWVPQVSGASQHLNGVYFVDASHGWAVGGNGTIRFYDGSVWSVQTSGTTKRLNGVYFVDANTGWAVGGNGTIIATTDGGSTWGAQVSGTSMELNAVSFCNTNQGVTVGDNGTILRTSDGGTTWTSPEGNQVNKDLRGVSFADAYTGWAAGQTGVVVHTADGGTIWQEQGSKATFDLGDVHFVNAERGWLVGRNGIIRKTIDGGNTWNIQNSGVSADLEGVHFVGDDQGWAVGENGTIIATTNGGSTWSTQTSNTSDELRSVHFVDMNIGWAVGKSGTIQATTDGGTTWTSQTSGTGNDLDGVHFVDADVGWAVGSGGLILKTGNGGANWTPQTSGTGAELWSVYFLDANRGWAVGAGGTVRVTTDGGANWQGQTSGTTQDLYALTFADLYNGWAVGQQGTILKYSAAYTTAAEAQSLNVNATASNVTNATLAADHTLNDQTIAYYLSNNGGTDWFEVALGVDHNFATIGSDLRWRAVLSTTDPALTPFVESLSILYQTEDYSGAYRSTGSLESSTFDAGRAATFCGLYWNSADEPANTTLKFQLAANNDNTTWNFVGPDGTSGSYYTRAGGEAVWSGHNGQSYIRYRAYLETTDDSVTPVLSEVHLTYVPQPAARIKTLHLQENGAADEMNTIPPTATGNAGDYDSDGDPGLTIDKNGGTHSWGLAPPFASGFHITGTAVVYLWIDNDGKGGQTGEVRVTLSSTSGGIGNPVSQDILFDDWSADDGVTGWERFPFEIPNLDASLSAGDRITLTVEVLSNKDLWFAYDRNNAAPDNSLDSTIDLSTDTYVSVDWVRTYDAAYPGGVVTDVFVPGETVYLRADVSDPFGSYDIAGANVTVYDPGLALVVDGAVMTPVFTTTGSIAFEHSYAVPSEAPAGIYNVVITATESNGVIANGGALFTIVAPELSLTKSDGSDPVSPGDTLVYTVAYTNSGAGDATGLVITETYDGNVNFDSASPPPDEGDDRWTIGDLDAGQAGTIIITVTVNGGLPDGTILTNMATLGSDQTGPVTAVETTLVRVPVLQLTKSDNPDPVAPSGNLVYTLTCTNIGGASATGVVITETYDSNVSFVSASITPTVGNNVWNIGALIPGASNTIVINVAVNGGLPNGTILTNTVTVDSDQTDPVVVTEPTTVETTSWPTYQIEARVGGTIIVVRVQIVNGRLVIISWEILP